MNSASAVNRYTRLWVLVACERSGRVRDAFRLAGHNAYSCDLAAADNGGPHIQADVRTVLDDGWDLIIGHPPCTYLSQAFPQNWSRYPERVADALKLAADIWTADAGAVAIENPKGLMTSLLGPATQIVQPWWFGDPYTKATCLWLKGLLPLLPTHHQLEVCAYPKRATPWWCESRTERHRSPAVRSISFTGVAMAMAGQWTDTRQRELTDD
jgi:hypothetical protein